MLMKRQKQMKIQIQIQRQELIPVLAGVQKIGIRGIQDTRQMVTGKTDEV